MTFSCALYHSEYYSKAHFILCLSRPRLNSNQSIPISAIIEISAKGFTLRVKVEIENVFLNLPFYGPCLAPRQKDTYQVGRPIPNLQPFGAMLLQYNIVVLMKSTLLIKVNLKPNTLSSPFSFHLSSFFVSLLVELLYLFVNDEKGFFFLHGIWP